MAEQPIPRTDLDVNYVSPGNSVGSTFSSISTAFGLSTRGFQALLNDLKVLDSSVASVSDIDRLVREGKLSRASAGGYKNSIGSSPFIFSFQNLSSEFPGPSKFYTAPADGKVTQEIVTSGRWVLPVPPADFSVSVPNSQNEVTSLNGFSYTHAGPIQLDEITFEGFLPYINTAEVTRAIAPRGSNSTGRVTGLNLNQIPDFIPEYLSFTRPNAIGSAGGSYAYHSPKEWVSNLVTAMRANQPLLFSVYSASGADFTIKTDTGVIIEPVAMSVSAFNWNMGTSVGGSRGDISYSITLKRWRRQYMSITNYVKQPAQSVVGAVTWPVGSKDGHTTGGNTKRYTVIKGDYLKKISAKSWVLGSANRAGEIYNANKTKIDNDYKKYIGTLKKGQKRKSRYSYPMSPGLTLKIPRR